MKKFLQLTLKEAQKNLTAKHGGPFGALIVIENKIIAQAHNTVLKDNDPTAHAEINAIRQACQKLKNPHLEKATLYVNAEPCPMCLAAAYWAHIKKIVFINNKEDINTHTPFIDKKIYDEICSNHKSIKIIKDSTLNQEGLEVFKAWQEKNISCY